MSSAAIIVNFRTPELTAHAVSSVLDEPGVAEVVVVDNGSGDGSAARLETRFRSDRVRILQSHANLGYGGGINLGVEATTAPYLLFLNSDAVIGAGTAGRLEAQLAAEPAVGIVAPAVQLADGASQPGAYGSFPRLSDLVRRPRLAPEQLEPDWVSGVAMMVRRTDFLQLGGFDEEFFMYMEDVDLCRRMRRLGRVVRRDPSAVVIHQLAQSSDLGSASRAFRRSRALYARKAALSTATRLAFRLAAGASGGPASRSGADGGEAWGTARRRARPRRTRNVDSGAAYEADRWRPPP